MIKAIVLIFVAILSANLSISQSYLKPFTGFSVDLNNNNKFKQINTGLQYSYRVRKGYELVFQVQKTIAIPYRTTDSSFSANTNLPVYSSANKTINASSFLVAVGHRLTVKGANTKNTLNVVFYTGISFQKFTVDYDCDKANYIVLNPDKSIHHGSVYVSVAL